MSYKNVKEAEYVFQENGHTDTRELPCTDIHKAKLTSSLVQCTHQSLSETTNTGCLRTTQLFNIII
jgi:hypothetical protein